MLNFKIRVTPKTSAEVQKYVFKNNGSWCRYNLQEVQNTKYPYLYINNGEITYGNNEYLFNKKNLIELSIDDLK